MEFETVTLNLPEAVYKRISQASEKVQRPVGDVLVEAVVAAAPVVDVVSPNMRSALAQMAYLNDAALWQAARSTMPRAQRERLAELHDKQQRTGLTKEEQAEEQALLTLYRETLLVRAQAAALLHQRGYDVSDPGQFMPLE